MFNVGPVMKACDSFIKWKSPPRKLAKEVFVEFIPAKEKNSFAKEWRKVLAKDHVIRIESHEVFNTAQVNVESKEEKVERAEFNVPTCGHIAVCQRCRDRQIQSLFPTSSLFSTLKVRLRVCPGKPARQNRHRHMYTPCPSNVKV